MLTTGIVEVAAAWATETVCPAMVSVPVRVEAAVFAAALKVAVPPPAPGEPAVTASHASLAVADQVQPAAAVTATEPVPPPAAIDCDPGVSANVHASLPG